MDSAYNLARWITGHDQDAEDVVQEAYIRAFRGFENYTDLNMKELNRFAQTYKTKLYY